ncbi:MULTISPECIES: hybrid sensor histidine kinase/response regulator [Pseudomonas]|uniref:hybrid sensor histidine kinase/response regulator n=1 Tax=Pseudomonas TaxID=286 RepID=UPI00031F4E23|nr:MULTISPECIES: PAS domain-containing sensor histidine kinase [Pseudomonas]ROL78111.1 hybrid sensor histidine kinase/response regulator [Pseudomonas chlororaphis]WDG53246.1 PAS domain S-box protein [Pseudomonas chlororaphis]WDH50592.1 PAS domain S-box protein [Pseudomonas chlororaphis]WDH85732.1 PAS domain S-box protein [Pseudomonas chlororaphis]SFQ55650.1 PAS domain S-box-containing protein [Pseudomonas sp. NFPP07]
MADQPRRVLDEDRFRLLVEAVVDYAIYMIDPQGIVTSWNAGARRFKGYQEAEILGAHFSCFYTPEDRQAGLPERALNTALTEGRFEGEGWRVRKDGTRFWCHVVIDPIRDSNGQLLGFAKITRDLTERKIAEETLRQSEQQFRLLVQSVTDYAIYMLDPNGRVSSWNLGAQRIKGYLPQEIIGEHFSRFYTEQDRLDGVPLRTLEIATREGRFEKQGWRVRKDGTQFLAHVIIDPIRGDAGELLGFAKVTRDISETVEAQKALESAREALFQAQKLQAIGQLSGGIAHDFNNLLTVILGNLELARKRIGDDPKLSRLLDNAVVGAERGVSLTQRMLAFARRQELKTEPVALTQLMTNLSGLLGSSLGPQVSIFNELPESLPTVLADVNQLELAVLNLATNARDAMPGGGTLVFKADLCDSGQAAGVNLPHERYVRLCVIDSGEGMDEQTLALAADPFFTTKGVGKGTGLGLSMVHGLAEQLGGRLILKSLKGQGTTAELWLPLASQATPVVPARLPAPDSQQQPLCVLVVDDDSLVLTSTTLLLEDLGHQVLCAMSGAQALQRFAEYPAIDLMITDLAMPVMDGGQLASAVRELRPDLPIILASGYAQRLEGLAAALPRVPKPYTQLQLIEALAQAVRQTPSSLRTCR